MMGSPICTVITMKETAMTAIDRTRDELAMLDIFPPAARMAVG